MMGSKAKIIVVDDDKDVRDGIRLVLETCGYDVDTASDGEKGILLIESSPFDIAVIDLYMPRKEGIEMIMELRSAYPDLGIIAISGGGKVAGVNYLDLAKKLGANATLMKPFSSTDIIDAVNELVAA